MQFYRRGSFLSSIPTTTRNLILINLGLFLVQIILGDTVTSLFSLNFYRVTNRLQIWQVFTYMFMHGGLWHVFLNMFALYMFGGEMERNWGPSVFLKYYLITGLGAGIFIFLTDLTPYLYYRFFQSMSNQEALIRLQFGTTLGASGAVFAVVLGYTLYFPDRKLIIFPLPIPIKAKYIMMFGAGVSLFFMIFGSGRGVSHEGHFGGILAGVIFFRYNKNNYLFRPANNTLDDFFDRLKNIFTSSKPKIRVVDDDPKSKSSIFSKFGNFSKRSGDDLNEENMTDNEIENKIDELLDVISRKGIKALSMEEQLFLDRVSRLYRHKFPD
jgi:membrane associated rhomboid family serine protease